MRKISPYLALIATLLALHVVACQQKEEAHKSAYIPPAVSSTPTVLATIKVEHKATGADPLIDNRPLYRVEFNPKGLGAAYIADVGGSQCLVFKGQAGVPTLAIDRVSFSPEGRRVAYIARLEENKWSAVVDGLPGPSMDEVSLPSFSPDSTHVAYWGKLGNSWFMAVDSARVERDRPFVGEPVFSADSSRVAYMQSVEAGGGGLEAVIADLSLKALDIKKDLADKFLVSPDKTKVAVIVKTGSQKKVLEFSFAEPGNVKEGPVFDEVLTMAYGQDSAAVAYLALEGPKGYIVMRDVREELPEGMPYDTLAVSPDSKAVGIVLSHSDRMFLHLAFSPGLAPVKHYKGIQFPALSAAGESYAHVATRGSGWFVVVNGHEGPVFDRVVTPLFSPDGKRVVYRARHKAQRFLVVADLEGKILRRYPEYEMVFEPAFTPDGKSVAYGVKDGPSLAWKVEALP